MKKKFVLCLMFILALSLLFTHPIISQEQLPPEIYLVKIDNYIINPITAEFISKAVKEATDSNATCLIIELDTPGGLLEATRNIVKDILNAKIPIVTYIAPSGSRAGSAGVFITYASHIAAMAPSTNIGAAHPVGIGFKPPPNPTQEETKDTQPEKDIMEEKVMNDILAWVEGIAKTRKRNLKWIKEAVTESVSVSEKEALKNNVVDFIAIDLNDLIKQIDGKTVETNYGQKTINTKEAQINVVELSNREKALNAIAHPNIAYI